MKLRALRYTLLLGILFGISFLLRASLPSVATGTWVSAGNMSAARSGACTVALNDGRLLISGGADANGPTATADLFSTTGSWSAAASMNSPRSHQSCAVLQDGRVLVAGGTTSGGGITNSAEIYDPSADSWAQAGLMNDARSGATASVLQDGRVLIAGGRSSDGPPILISNTLEIFDPSTNNFSNAGTMSSPRQDHAAAVLSDGRVLIVGGSDGTNALNTTDIYDPQAGSVSAGPAMSTPRAKATAITLLDGTVVVIGGSDGTNDLASAEFFDPAANNFNAAGSLTTARSKHSAFLLPNNNEVLVVGGQSAGTDLASAELYIPWQKAFQPTGAMATPRSDASGAALTKVDGRVLIAGGSSASAELYGFATVKTDAADYPPGTTVNITGTGWQPGETVTLTLVESPLIDTHGPYPVVADAFGNISNSSFVTDAHDENIRFYLTAAGSQSQAQNTFTDSKPNTVTLSPATATVLAGSTATYSVTVNFNGNGNPCTSLLSLAYTGSTPVGATATFNPSSLTSTGGNANSTLTITTKNTGPMSGRTQPGTYPFTVTAGSGSGCQAGTATVNGTLAVAGSATGLSVTGYPSPTTAGTSQSFTVTALDANGNTALGYTGTVHFTSSDAQAVLPANYTFVAADNGTHTFTATLKTAGTQSITATDTVTGTVTGTQGGIAVNAAATANLLLAGYPSPVTAGTSNSFTVTAQDAFGNLTAGYTGTVHFTSSDGAATLPANYTFTTGNGKDNGTHTFSATLNTAGTQSITATDTVTASINGTQSGITVNASTVATSLALAAPSPTSVPFGSTGLVTFSATLTRTTGGAAVSGATVNFTVDGNAAGSATTNGSGVATISNYNPSALSVAGHNVQASFAGATISGSTYTASTSGTQTLTVTARVTSTSISPLTASTAAGTAATFTITVTDTDSGTKSNPAGTVAVTSTSSPSNTDSISACALTHGANPLGTVSCQINVTPTTPFAVHTINASFTATDSAHANSSTTAGAALTVSNPDTKPPVVSITFSAVDGQNGWYVHSPVLGTVSADDTTTGNSNVTAISCTDGVNPLTVGSPTGIGTHVASGSLSISGEGTHNISCQATDSAGNTGASTGSTAMPVVVKIDTVAPTLTATRLTAANANGWNNTNVNVEFTCTDSTSGLASISATGAATGSSATSPLDVTVTSEASGQSVNGACKDAAGNSATPQSVANINIDKTKPVITGGRTPAANANNWNNTNVTVSFTCADTGGSGVDTNTVAGATVSTEGENQSVTNTGSCVDKAGNAADSATVNGINIDKTPPNPPTAVRTPAANANGWNNTDVAVSFTDNGDAGTVKSGIDSCTTGSSVTAETSGTDVSGTCTDKAGNVSAIAKVTVRIDKTKPVITGGRTPAANANNWNNTNVTVSFTCADTGGSGVDTNTVAGATVSTEGENQSVTNTGSCVDKAGNAADSATVNGISIDKTPPNPPTAVRTPAANANGWNNTDVAVSFTDNGDAGTVKSGIDSCTTGSNLTGETSGTDVSGTCTDKAGNTSTIAKVTVRIDKTKPVITGGRTPAANANGWNNTDVTVNFTCAETGAVESGLDTNTVAGQTLTAEVQNASVTNTGSCVDKAGNAADSSTVSAINIDKTPPNPPTPIRTPAANANGWNNTDVSVSFTSNGDAGTVKSGIDSCTTGSNLTAETSGTDVSGTCTDIAGNTSAVAKVTVKIDKTKPVITGGRTPAANANGWNNTDVTVNFTCAETGAVESGLDTNTVAGQTLTAEVLNASVSNTGSCVDKAGNAADSSTVSDINIDKTPPNPPTPVRTPAANANGWNNTDVSVSFTNNGDAGTVQSGIDSCTAGSGLTAETSGTDVSGTCTDKAGNTSTIAKVTVKIDETKPVITGGRTPAANANGWNNTDVTVTFTCAETGVVESGLDTNTVAGQTLTAEVLSASVTNTGSCVDAAGNAADPATVSGINIDKTPPNPPTPVRAPAANPAGWNNTDVAVSFTDNGDAGTVKSGVDSCTAGSGLTAETSGTDVSGTCTDKAGNTSAVAKVTVKIDKTKPVITGSRNPAPNGFGWNNTDVTVTFACAETGAVQSGVASNTVAGSTVSSEGASQSATNTGNCVDVAGNTADSSTVNNINIDKTKPTASAARDVPPNAFGWNNTDVTVTFSGNDSLSGIASCDAPITRSGEGTSQSASGTCKDKADNVSDPASVTNINIDKTKPVITGSRAPLANAYGWNNTDVSVSFACADAGSVQSGLNINTVTGATLSGEGAGQFITDSGSCTDKAGNAADSSTVSGINIDKTNPTITLTITPGSPAVTGWYNISTGKPTVTFTCGDSLSGVASCTPPVLVGEGANQTIAGNAMDKAGNSASTSIMHVNVDVTAPTINVINPGSSGSYLLNQSANASYSCSDAGSSGLVAGSAGCGGPVANGSQFDTASVGSKNFTVNAKDVAGNTASQTNTYGVFYSTGACLGSAGHTILQPINFTGDSVFPKKQGSSVPAKFRVCDANGNSIGAAGVVSNFLIYQIVNGTVTTNPNETVDSTTPDTAFRFDPSGGQWIYNISTKSYNAGSTYFFRVFLNDGTNIDFDFGLR